MLSIKNIFAVVSATTLVFLASTTASFASYEGPDDIPDPMCPLGENGCLNFLGDPEPQSVTVPEPTSVLGIIAFGGLMAGIKKSKNKKK